MKRFLGSLTGVLIFCFCTGAQAQQTPCPKDSATFNGKLACMLPDLYGSTGAALSSQGKGVFGLPTHLGHFDASIGSTLTPINNDISQQLSLLPVTSPGSGFSLTFDPALKTFVTSTDSLGPILGERADTIGKHRFAVGVSYQFFRFDRIDGVNLSNFPAVFTHAADINAQTPPGTICTPSTATPAQGTGSITSNQSLASFGYPPNSPPTTSPLGDCSFVRDQFKTTNSIKLRVHQVTTYVTFGLTRNLDVSLVIPYVDVLFGVSSDVTIQTGTYYSYHFFRQANDGVSQCPLNNGAEPAMITQAQIGYCYQHHFPDATLSPGSGPASSFAKGIGDITVRLKEKIYQGEGERLGFAAGVDIRFPTGDALNYLGSGAYGVRPFLISSYHGRVAPHGMVSYEANGSSLTGGDVTTGAKGQIPNEFVYDVGVDAYATKRLTGAFDIIGQRVFNTQFLAVTPKAYLAPCINLIPATGSAQMMYYDQNKNNPPASCTVFVQPQNTAPETFKYYNADGSANNGPATVMLPNLSSASGVSTNLTNASMGGKVALMKRLVLSLNVLVRLDNGGLHSKPAPMAGLEYTF
jgi:hypothetical protein